jgi:hypothetical protein
VRQEVRKLIDDNDRGLVSPADVSDGAEGVIPGRDRQPPTGRSEVIARCGTKRIQRLGPLLLDRW